jgi:hypothetical protein
MLKSHEKWGKETDFDAATFPVPSLRANSSGKITLSIYIYIHESEVDVIPYIFILIKCWRTIGIAQNVTFAPTEALYPGQREYSVGVAAKIGIMYKTTVPFGIRKCLVCYGYSTSLCSVRTIVLRTLRVSTSMRTTVRSLTRYIILIS